MHRIATWLAALVAASSLSAGALAAAPPLAAGAGANVVTPAQGPAGAPSAAPPTASAPSSADMRVAEAVKRPGASAVPDDYVVGPGDSIQVFVWMNPELSANVAVRPDGKISTPLVEDMVAAGKTPSTLARDIEGVLGDYLKQPKVNVIVVQAVSTYRQVKVVGQVRAPQSLAYRDGLRVLDAILAVGGVTEFAAPNRARIVRNEGGQQKRIKVRLGDLVGKGEVEENLALKPGDILVVPQSMF
jgi:polysaccharide export outer membrane protein